MREPDETDDPGTVRVSALLEKVVRGQLNAAETEELTLYADQDPTVGSRLGDARRTRALGRGWLQRVQSQALVEKVEHSRRSAIERGTGVALVGLSWFLNIFAAPLAVLSLAAGVGLLLYSFIRVRMATYGDDPYRDVKR